MKLYCWTLPRWFGAPIAVAAIVLGAGVSEGINPLLLFLTAVSGCFLMAWGHSMNTWLDYYWTKLDQGDESSRSRPKPYTDGQQVLATGATTGGKVLAVSLLYLVASLLFAVPTILFHPWAVIPWAVSAGATFWYSWGKLHYQCELALGVGFGPAAAIFGAATTSSPNILYAGLGSLPIFLAFGFAAEIFDQWWDADTNWDKGLRNIGALCWKHDFDVSAAVVLVMAIAMWTQIGLVYSGVLSSMTVISFLAIPGLFLLPSAANRNKTSVMITLLSLFLYVMLIAIGEVI